MFTEYCVAKSFQFFKPTVFLQQIATSLNKPSLGLKEGFKMKPSNAYLDDNAFNLRPIPIRLCHLIDI